MDEPQYGPRGRGASANPTNRFTHLTIESEEPPPDRVPTIYLRDTSRAVIARNDSPDVGFRWSVNPYRGCFHACSYCCSGRDADLDGGRHDEAAERVRVGDAIYGTVRRGDYRRYVRTTVLDAGAR